jgi:hypothetical protein
VFAQVKASRRWQQNARVFKSGVSKKTKLNLKKFNLKK